MSHHTEERAEGVTTVHASNVDGPTLSPSGMDGGAAEHASDVDDSATEHAAVEDQPIIQRTSMDNDKADDSLHISDIVVNEEDEIHENCSASLNKMNNKNDHVVLLAAPTSKNTRTMTRPSPPSSPVSNRSITKTFSGNANYSTRTTGASSNSNAEEGPPTDLETMKTIYDAFKERSVIFFNGKLQPDTVTERAGGRLHSGTVG
ncbi:unnamed protein product, partial [Amoebophrya sp. A25]|eukprot:GSA25T00003072001.1